MLSLLPLALKVAPALFNLFNGANNETVLQKIGDIAKAVFGTTDPGSIESQMQSDQAKLEAFTKQVQALSASDVAQSQVNQAEAASPMFFVAGWRPFIGWVCGAGVAYQFVAFPFLVWLSTNCAIQGPPPLDISQLMTLLTGMLGLGTLRFLDKKNGVDTKTVQAPKFKLFK